MKSVIVLKPKTKDFDRHKFLSLLIYFSELNDMRLNKIKNVGAFYDSIDIYKEASRCQKSMYSTNFMPGNKLFVANSSLIQK